MIQLIGNLQRAGLRTQNWTNSPINLLMIWRVNHFQLIFCAGKRQIQNAYKLFLNSFDQEFLENLSNHKETWYLEHNLHTMYAMTCVNFNIIWHSAVLILHKLFANRNSILFIYLCRWHCKKNCIKQTFWIQSHSNWYMLWLSLSNSYVLSFMSVSGLIVFTKKICTSNSSF